MMIVDRRARGRVSERENDSPGITVPHTRFAAVVMSSSTPPFPGNPP
jgi:hypothetical protein